MTRVDALTGLANRRAYENVYPKAWQQVARARGDLAPLVCDLDHFKALNDGHGHLAGDACLQHFARLVEQCFRRESDLLARIGGEELVVVLPGSTAGDGERMAETLRARLEERPCEWQGKTVPMTVSIGVGCADCRPIRRRRRPSRGSTRPVTRRSRADVTGSSCRRAKLRGRAESR
jgi:diguanylate cyclase (GGDEF)-like protein